MRMLYVVTHPEATHHVERRVGGWYGMADGKPQSWLDERFRTPPPAGERLRHN
ncbi:hypothetical protein [uncultured Aeromicrobium sp.]|uniref:hypothetical protein n=1 Tax=uncultured Aeromicrobium sp. TaxID=337820 RepID=UPI0025EA0B9A|nr:hypothetical protein [uncultured Aeromicrobium sp.]